MTIEKEFLLMIDMLISAILGSLIGIERERHVGSAGIRTHASVAIGACVFGILSIYCIGVKDASRISAQIVSGIGFIGAGVILRDQGRVTGLTTAASLWTTAAIGLAVANHIYLLAISTTIILVSLLSIRNLPSWMSKKNGKRSKTPIKD